MKSAESTILTFLLNISKNELFVALVGAIVAGFLAFFFGLRAQRKALQEQHRLKMYDDFWVKRDELSSAIIGFSSQLRGFSIECILIRAIYNSKVVVPKVEYERKIQERWAEYLKRIADYGTSVSLSYTHLYSLIEQNHFILSDLNNSFRLYGDEYQKLFETHLDLMGYMYKLNPSDLVDKKKEKEVQAEIDRIGSLEQCADLISYSMDLFGLIQYEMIGNVFRFKHEERKPRDGKILTKGGWKEVGND